ncbi:hypothetical protein M3E13_03020 [Oceanobacillus kimchii]|uniref:hypothetical protein n=1 Tax=Oceanobacillus kimchii TaxID=746691 RepID=UPI00034B58CE|nr:hypothetical protein [Oceanobacillus kimchii]MCT1576808.1 hypothetical protein [Oceanobacillus kimchii]MCT2134878.1 hypothetical protein [Oceanobacillus kimchii]
MSLYMNENKNVYKSEEQLNAPNQQVFIRSHMSEVLKEQKEIQHSIVKSIRRLNRQVAGQGYDQQKNWSSITEQLEALEKGSLKHQVMERDVLHQLKALEETQQSITIQLQKESLFQKQLTNKLQDIKGSQESLQLIVESIQTTNGEFTEKFEEQNQMQHEIVRLFNEKEEETEKVHERLESQGALLEKVIRQMDHFRGVIYERTNYLSKKLESTVAYMLTKLTGDNDDKQEEMQEKKEKQNV